MADGKWVLRSEFIEGKTMQRLMDENPENYSQYLEEFVDIKRYILS